MNDNPNFSHSNSESFHNQDVLNDSEIPPFDPDAAIARREAVLQQEKQAEQLEHPEYRTLEDLLPTLNAEHSVIMGHGTASSASNQQDTIHSIFKQGLKGYESLGSMVGEDRKNKIAGSTDLSQTAVGLYDTDTTPVNLDSLRDKLNHWPHRDAKNVVLMRLPIEYFNMQTAFPEERNQPFFTQHADNQGQMTNYLDRRFIIGNYNVDSGLVELNPYFVSEPDQNFQQEMTQRLSVAQQNTADRVARMEAQSPFKQTSPETNQPAPESPTGPTINSVYQPQTTRPDRQIKSVGEHSAILADLDGHTKGIESEYFNLGFDRAECLQDNPELKSAITDFIFEVAKVDGTHGASFDNADTAPIESFVRLLQIADKSNPVQQEVVRDMFGTLTNMGGALTLIRDETRRHPEVTEKIQQENNQVQTPEEPQQIEQTETKEEASEEQAEHEWRARRIESLVAAIEDQIKSTERRADDAEQDLQHLQAMIEEELSARTKADTNMLRSYNRRYSDYNDELNIVSRKLSELADDLLTACSHGREDLEPQRFDELRRRGSSLLDQSEEVKKSFRQNLDYFDDTSRRIRQLEQLVHGW